MTLVTVIGCTLGAVLWVVGMAIGLTLVHDAAQGDKARREAWEAKYGR